MRMLSQSRRGGFGYRSRFIAVTHPIDHSNQYATRVCLDQMLVATLALSRQGFTRHPPFYQQGSIYFSHFFITTVVPCPGWEAISNSSISRLAPDKPKPKPLPVE